MCRGNEFHRGRKSLVEDPCHVLHVECDGACDGAKAKLYPFGLSELEHGGCEEVRMNLSGFAISGHRGVRVSEGFLDPAQVVRETFSFLLFHIGILHPGGLVEASFVTSIADLRTGVGKRGVILTVTFPIPAVDIPPSPAFRTVVQLGKANVFRKGDVDELTRVGPFCDESTSFSRCSLGDTGPGCLEDGDFVDFVTERRVVGEIIRSRAADDSSANDNDLFRGGVRFF